MNEKKTINILLVEDEEGHVELIRRAFESSKLGSVNLTVAKTVQEARKILAESTPGLAIIDYKLPDGEGIELLQPKPSCPIIIMTGQGDEKVAVASLKAGALDYFVKSEEMFRDMPHIAERVLREWENILKRKQAEEDLKESEKKSKESKEKYEDLYNNAPVAFFSVSIDGIIKRCNCKAEEMTEYSNNELIGMNVIDLYFDAPDGKEKAMKIVRKFKSGQPIFNEELLMKKKKGEPCWINLTVNVIKDKDGNVTESRSVAEDITERKRVEDELHRLGKTIEQSAEDIMITGIDTNIQYVNPAFEKITGYKKNEVIGKNPRILQSGKQDEQFYNKMWDALAQGKVWSGHFINKKKDGTLFEEDATISPVFDNSGNIINYVAVKRDVTKEVMLENQLRQSQKLEAIGTLAGGIAHDFNNILTGIMGYTELSIDKLPEDSEISGHLSQVLKSSCRARDLIKQILTFTRQIEKELKPLELGSVIKEALKLMKSSLPSTIKIRSNIDIDTGIIVADLTQMHQLIMNLCVNAEYAMRKTGGILEINLDSVNVDADLASILTNLKEGPYIKLTVRDTGHGMDKKIAEKVFDPFFTTKKVGEGTGMGLTIVHGIVLSHGGEISINSEPGKGTTFEIYLPKVDTTLKKENLKTQPIQRGSERILLVEDEKTVLNLEQKILENLGYNVVAKDNSLDALEAFKADPKRFDIVITDQTMPYMSGDALAGELMRIQRDIPVILCTGFSHSITREKAEAIGIRKFIMKPFNIRDMAVAICEALEKEK